MTRREIEQEVRQIVQAELEKERQRLREEELRKRIGDRLFKDFVGEDWLRKR